MAKTRKRIVMRVEISAPQKGSAAAARKLVGEMIKDMSGHWELDTYLFESAPIKLISIKPMPKA